MPVVLHSQTATILNGATESDAVPIGGRAVVAVRVGTVAATTASFKATMTKPASPKGVADTATYVAVRDSAGDVLSFETPDDSHIVLDPAAIISAEQIKIVAGTAASGNESWTVITREVQ